jgi:hypothetical protein
MLTRRTLYRFCGETAGFRLDATAERWFQRNGRGVSTILGQETRLLYWLDFLDTLL